ncbi:spermatogenesis-associated protein 1-like isoform X5 [Haliotis rubra]|uniref:spermatogenesis-associated protein 1-like isoform X5 n=1 Tax=Haliotis rubra TaxID=36100 RepID=UPI001EE5738A|nr:spermatogenesis-associated protein 1-like isoform X5 [Haliotis rubra]
MSRADFRSTNSRPPSASDQLVDLHVYVVPADIWRDRYNNLLNQSVTETISAGIIRVQPDIRLADLRDDIVQQLEDLAPREYVFLRSVGRSLTRLKTKQEYTLKVKHFLPPVAYAPELFLLEASGDVSLASEGDSRSQSSFRQLGDSPKGNNRGYNYRDDYRDPGSRSYRDDKYNNDRNGSPHSHRRGDETYRPSNKYQHGDGRDRSPDRHQRGDGKDRSPDRHQRGDGTDRTSNSDKRGDGTDRSSRTHPRGDGKDRSSHARQRGDSGVSPEDQYNRGRDNYEDELARKRRDLGNRLANDKFDAYDDDAFRFEDMEDRDQIDRDRWERDREYRRRWIEEERRRREDELEARKKRQEAGEEDDDDDDRKKMKRSESEEELARYPSPPELRMDSPRDTESARQRTRQERDRLMHELENAREGRKHTEKEREELVKKAKMLQNKTQNRRNHARDIWKKRYFEEKKKTAPLEEQTNRLKHELDSIHRKLMSALEGPKEKNIRLGEPKPSLKNNYIILCTKLQHEIEDLRRRVENAKMKLTAEMKLRNQAEAELRALRAELTQKKINLTLTRNQHLAALNPSGEVPSSPRSVIAPQS